MLVAIVFLLTAGISAHLARRRSFRGGLGAAFVAPICFSVIAAATLRVPVPGIIGSLWIFVICLVVLSVVSIGSFALARAFRPFPSTDRG